MGKKLVVLIESMQLLTVSPVNVPKSLITLLLYSILLSALQFPAKTQNNDLIIRMSTRNI